MAKSPCNSTLDSVQESKTKKSVTQTTKKIRNHVGKDDDSTYAPPPRQKRRTAAGTYCCSCSRFGTCAARQDHWRPKCECRQKGDFCISCVPGKKCKNQPYKASAKCARHQSEKIDGKKDNVSFKETKSYADVLKSSAPTPTITTPITPALRSFKKALSSSSSKLRSSPLPKPSASSPKSVHSSISTPRTTKQNKNTSPPNKPSSKNIYNSSKPKNTISTSNKSTHPTPPSKSSPSPVEVSKLPTTPSPSKSTPHPSKPSNRLTNIKKLSKPKNSISPTGKSSHPYPSSNSIPTKNKFSKPSSSKLHTTSSHPKSTTPPSNSTNRFSILSSTDDDSTIETVFSENLSTVTSSKTFPNPPIPENVEIDQHSQHSQKSNKSERSQILFTPDSQSAEDLKKQILSPAEKLLQKVYGDSVHTNDGTQLDGGIENDKIWQDYWYQIVSYSHPLYDAPFGAVGKRFVSMMANLWQDVMDRKCNSEIPILFPTIILRKKYGIYKAKDIKRRITRRLDAWDNQKFDALVQDTIDQARQSIGKNRPIDEMAKARKYNSLLNSGKLKEAVTFATGSLNGSPLNIEDIDVKTGKPVLEVLKSKHPDIHFPDINGYSFEEYPKIPDALQTEISEEMVEKMAKKISGSGGPSSVHTVHLKSWLLYFDEASAKLRSKMALWTEWIANSSPPYAAYRAENACRECAHDKHPGVRPLGIGEAWRRCSTKLLIEDNGDQAKLSCGTTELCSGMDAGIEGAYHSIRIEADEDPSLDFDHQSTPNIILSTNSQTDPTGITLIDAKNGFNEIFRLSMLWTIRHRWPKGCRYAFNRYRHFIPLVVR